MATKGEKTRESIIDASYALFAEKGFKQVTMKDVCEATNMSRGGLYSHFAGTDQLFEALLEKISENGTMDFQSEIKKGTSAASILEKAFKIMEEEAKHPEGSLSIAIYEYAETVNSDVMERLNKESKKKWKQIIRYGIENGEFKDTDVDGIVNTLLFSYQGIRMWSRIIPMNTKTIHSVLQNIKRQLAGEQI